MLPYTQARLKVIEAVSGLRRLPRTEDIALAEAAGRILSAPISADRDYPPFDRAARDGFAVRATDAAAPGAKLKLIGEIKAGDEFRGQVGSGECAQIMTGAAVPRGADSVVMVEQTRAEGQHVVLKLGVVCGQNFVPRGSEARAGQQLLAPGTRLGFAEMAVAAQAGAERVRVARQPRVAILSTGDEVVELGKQPGPHQIRNSNNYSLSVQTQLAGGVPVALGNSPDREPELEALIRRGLQEDVLILSGGVSVGKYDLVEVVLKKLGAEFFFDAIAIRPGRPAVFGLCQGKPVFALPGNPVSTMVTFELLAVPALDILGGAAPRALPLFKARLAAPVKQKSPLTHFLPACATWEKGEAEVRELPWQGSGDIVALAGANCFLVVPQEKLEWSAGEWVDVLPRRGML